MIALRVLATVAGVVGLAAIAYVNIISMGGIGQPSSWLMIASQIIVGIGAMVVGSAFAERRRLLGGFLVFFLACGEVYGFYATANWHVATIEEHAAPVHEAEAKRKAAEDRVARLERDDRVERAERSLKEARADANAQSTAKSCNKGCIATLAKTVDDASASAADARQSLQLDMRQARAALDGTPLPGSANALADRLGAQPWELDLASAALRSLALNGAAACFLAFAAHGRRHAPPPARAPVSEAVAPVLVAKKADDPAPRKVTRFMIESIERAPRSRIEVSALYAAYRAWCKANGVCALPAPQFGDALVPLLDEVGIERKLKGDELFLVGVKLAS